MERPSTVVRDTQMTGPMGDHGSLAREQNVHATISRDCSQGSLAREEATLRNFGGVAVGESAHALSDYQMQLMLLEQQNQKRVMMAKQYTTARSRENLDQQQETTGGPSITSATSESAITAHPSIDITTPSVPYRVLHQVVCSDHYHYERPKLFSVAPKWINHSGSAHLNGDAGTVVHNISALVREAGNLSFLVMHYHECSNATSLDRLQTQQDDFRSELERERGVVVVSLSLKNVLNRISRCQTEKPTAASSGVIYRPVKTRGNSNEEDYSVPFLYHHRSALREAQAQAATPEAQEEISGLLDYIDAEYGQYFDEIDVLAAQGLVQPRNIDLLFCPNEVVITRSKDHLAACVLEDWPTAHNSIVSLDCWSWGCDGNRFRRKPVALSVTPPTQEVVSIRDLQVFPATFATEDEITYLRTRGKKSWGLRSQSFVGYEGWDFNADQYYGNETRWMVDYQTYRQIHPNVQAFSFDVKPKLQFDPWPLELLHKDEPAESHMIVMPPEVHGFSLKSKKWSTLLVENIRSVRWNKEAFDRLVLPAKTKDLVRSLVLVRAASRNPEQRRILATRRDDLIAGKGNGLIMLLHGGPGTGKTLTAESVAELAEMPLYSVTCGDIGTKPDVVENYLETVLMLGKRWNCVLLLDEADVFLEERSLADLERNSLVSVFLRTLEYYDGILILTSNRVGTFDAAFASRVQVSLHYETLDQPSRRLVWKNFLDMVQAESSDGGVDGGDADAGELIGRLDELSSHELNGRQIRNAFTTARQLALFKEESLSWDHMEQALSAVTSFNRYMHNPVLVCDEEWVPDEGQGN